MSPSSSISVQATGAGNDSPITMSRPAVTHMGRKSSRIEAWLSEQHRIVHTNPGDPTPVAKSIPYVVYPEPSGELVRQESVDSFVVVSERGGSRRSSRNASVVSTPSRERGQRLMGAVDCSFPGLDPASLAALDAPQAVPLPRWPPQVRVAVPSAQLSSLLPLPPPLYLLRSLARTGIGTFRSVCTRRLERPTFLLGLAPYSCAFAVRAHGAFRAPRVFLA